MPKTFMIGEYTITKVLTGEPWNENCYLVHHSLSGEGVIIDPGGAPELIIQLVEESGMRLRYILLTHAHHDHVGAVAGVCRQFGLPCQLHMGDARLLRQAPMYALRFAGTQIEPPEPVVIYDGQPVLELGSQSISVIHTPGHTKGSVCIDFGSFVFTGDTLLYLHVGRTDLPGGDAAQLATSISQLVGNMPEESILFPGHGRAWTISDALVWWRELVVAPPQYDGTVA